MKAWIGRFTLFVFSNNLEWAKKNLHFTVPIHFVEGCERDIEELRLMSKCKHNIIAHSTFSWWGAWLNPNPDKKVFAPYPWIKNGMFNRDIYPDKWLKVPVDYNNLPVIEMPPTYSIIVAVEDDIKTVEACLSSAKSQQFQYYEVIVIDDCSTDGSSEICEKLCAGNKNVRLIRLKRRIGRLAAWNLGLDLAQGKYVIFLNGADRLSPVTFFNIDSEFEDRLIDVMHSVVHLAEQSPDNHTLIGWVDGSYKELKRLRTINLTPVQRLDQLAMQQLNRLIGTKIFRRQFLLENYIRFNERLESKAELMFIAECLTKTPNIFLTPQAFYVRPNSATSTGISDRQKVFDEFMSELDRVTSEIDNVNERKRIKKLFAHQFVEEQI